MLCSFYSEVAFLRTKLLVHTMLYIKKIRLCTSISKKGLNLALN